MKKIIILPILVVAGMLILTGCRLTPDDVLKKSIETMTALKTVTTALDFSVESSGVSGKMTGTLQNELPARTHAVLESNGQKVEVLTEDGKSFYLFDPTTKTWQETPAETFKQIGIQLSPLEQINLLRGAMISLDGPGQDKVNGTDCTRITYDLDPEKLKGGFMDAQLSQAMDPGTLSGKGRACVAEKTFYLLENVVEIKFKVQGMEITETTSMTNSKINEAVDIPSLGTVQPTPTP